VPPFKERCEIRYVLKKEYTEQFRKNKQFCNKF